MLDTTTKRRIDTARDILVGKVPDPKSQVEQITIALIYKFMDDMDAESEELGGERRFFSRDFLRYGWAKLMHSGLGGHETLNLYAEAITKMPENPRIPLLFRNIFKNAYLPYRDPETLRSFLKIIDEFSYDHSERLGDAFEYLLSVLGSQGEAGQFRTPRHIIDFMVTTVDSKKNDTILDPACGTAGFLISSYKHILKANSSTEEIRNNDSVKSAESALHVSKIPLANGNLLTPDERGRLATNFKGYDISPDMVRLSLVNMYLHGFVDPHIVEYDTLTSEERWNEYADVILTNPPFMSPKGGIRPHKRFTYKSKRSEALFVDYLIEHLTPSGKAAIIVPDGIVNNKTFTKLRRSLLENGLYAVVSLHQYVFKPYAGARTCILFFDKTLKERDGRVLFADMDNDGYQKGVQRTKIDEDDIPELTKLIIDFKNSGKADLPNNVKYNIKYTIINLQSLDKGIYFHYIDQLTLFPNTYIYRNSVANKSKKSVRVADVFDIQKGSLQSSQAIPGQYRFVTASDENLTHEEYTHDTEALIIAVSAGGSLGKVQYVSGKFTASDLCFVLTPKRKSQTDLLFYLYYFKNIREQLVRVLAKGVSKPSINKTDFGNLLIDSFKWEQQREIGIKIREMTKTISDYQDKIINLENKLVAEINSIYDSND